MTPPKLAAPERTPGRFFQPPSLPALRGFVNAVHSQQNFFFQYYVFALDDSPAVCIDYSMSEHLKARAWRERHGLTFEQLAELTGYGSRAIRWMEQGLSSPIKGKSRKVAPWVWQRYRMCCAGVEAQLRSGKKFSW